MCDRAPSDCPLSLALSHDLRAPLGTALSFVQLLRQRRGEELGEEGLEFLGYIEGGLEEAQRMLTGILQRAERAQQTPVDAGAVLDRVLSNGLAAEVAAREAEIGRGELPAVRVDETHLYRLLQNLVSNGIKYCDGRPRLQVDAERRGPEWVFSVADDGVGIDPARSEDVFAPFRRLDDGREGTGVGLPLCREIVEQYGGRIWFESEPGAGTTFYFSLPS